jgi:hypothetical protein
MPTAISVKPGCLSNWRSAKRRSFMGAGRMDWRRFSLPRFVAAEFSMRPGNTSTSRSFGGPSRSIPGPAHAARRAGIARASDHRNPFDSSWAFPMHNGWRPNGSRRARFRNIPQIARPQTHGHRARNSEAGGLRRPWDGFVPEPGKRSDRSWRVRCWMTRRFGRSAFVRTPQSAWSATHQCASGGKPARPKPNADRTRCERPGRPVLPPTPSGCICEVDGQGDPRVKSLAV